MQKSTQLWNFWHDCRGMLPNKHTRTFFSRFERHHSEPEMWTKKWFFWQYLGMYCENLPNFTLEHDDWSLEELEWVSSTEQNFLRSRMPLKMERYPIILFPSYWFLSKMRLFRNRHVIRISFCIRKWGPFCSRWAWKVVSIHITNFFYHTIYCHTQNMEDIMTRSS